MRSRRQGFSLVEVVVSAGILAMLISLTASALSVSARSTKYDLARTEATSQARKIMQQLSRELAGAGGHEGGTDLCTPSRAAGAVNATSITFSTRTGLSGVEANDWTTPITYRLVANGDAAGDNDDDDRDGVFDEQRLERVQNTFATTLDESVTLFEIDRDAGSDMITITLEVSRPYQIAGVVQGGQDWVRTRLVTNVYVRNRT